MEPPLQQQDLLQQQCFPTFFWFAAHLISVEQFGDTPNWFSKYKDQLIVTIVVTTFEPTNGTPVGNPFTTH